jgi:hypothetical protein
MKYIVALVAGIVAWVVVGWILSLFGTNGFWVAVIGLLAAAFAFGGTLGVYDVIRRD